MCKEGSCRNKKKSFIFSYLQIKLAAEKIGFRGDYNRSYLFRNDLPPGSSPDLEDSVEDEAVDIENEMELDD